MLFICYPKCGTCLKAEKYLQTQNLEYAKRDIKTDNPTAEELRSWQQASGLPLKKFFNTSGLQYKALGLKDKLPQLSEEEQLQLLAADGMLVKRPLLLTDDAVLVGFKEAEWSEKLRQK
ncbi:arsenate reductase family protein [Phascolarctobacterium sp.]